MLEGLGWLGKILIACWLPLLILISVCLGVEIISLWSALIHLHSLVEISTFWCLGVKSLRIWISTGLHSGVIIAKVHLLLLLLLLF